MRGWLAALTLGAVIVPVPAAAQDLACAVPASAPPPTAAGELGLLRTFADGSGVRVAVIDTGIAAHPELRHLRAGADFVGADSVTGALRDCDSHGTIVAGIIGAATTGIAPGAEIISVRQTSAHYRRGEDAETGDLQTLTAAIHNALDEGARVINVSVVSCLPPNIATRVDDSGLTAALSRAESAGAVVVAAAGNASRDCEPGFTVFPAAYPTVLAVAARDDAHTVAAYSLPAALSAPGSVPKALSSTGMGWANGTMTNAGVSPYAGTSFAAPVVSGSVALLFSRYPELTPSQARELITAAAQPGGGAVDPLNVISQLSPDAVEPGAALTITPVQVSPSGAARRVSALGVGLIGVCALLLTAGGASRSQSARRRA